MERSENAKETLFAAREQLATAEAARREAESEYQRRVTGGDDSYDYDCEWMYRLQSLEEEHEQHRRVALTSIADLTQAVVAAERCVDAAEHRATAESCAKLAEARVAHVADCRLIPRVMEPLFDALLGHTKTAREAVETAAVARAKTAESVSAAVQDGNNSRRLFERHAGRAMALINGGALPVDVARVIHDAFETLASVRSRSATGVRLDVMTDDATCGKLAMTRDSQRKNVLAACRFFDGEATTAVTGATMVAELAVIEGSVARGIDCSRGTCYRYFRRIDAGFRKHRSNPRCRTSNLYRCRGRDSHAARRNW